MISKTNAIVFLVSSILCLLIGEVVMRAVTPKATFNHQQLYCRYDSLLGWEKIPDFAGLHHTTEYEVVEKINSRGIRGPEYALQKDSNEQRIVIIGDSFAEGYTVNFGDWFSQILQDSLSRKCPDEQYQVINTGTGGYSTDQELLYYRTEGVHFQPDLTVMLFCVNDLWYNVQSSYWRGEKPRYRLEGDSLTLTNIPVPEPSQRSRWVRAKEWLLTNSELVKRVKILKDKIEFATDDRSVPEEYIGYRIDPTEEVEEAWRVTAALLQEAKAVAEANGSAFVLFYIPEKIEIYEQDWEQFQQLYQINAARFDLDLYRKKLHAICTALDIDFLDPTEAFLRAATAQPEERLYYLQDGHWNARGNKLVGELLSDLVNCAR